jgi:cation diffusion facilitator family transporter
MRKFLIKTFIKDYENTSNPRVRDDYGKLAGVVGILSNTLLCIMKIVIGLLFNSLAILADGINNLADASSSILLLIGIKMASKPADQDHPYGHARIEYINGLIISLLIIMVGFQLLMASIGKIRNPDPLEFSYITVIILVLAILIKIWQAVFYIKIGNEIHSTTLKAIGTDSRNDVITTSAVLLSILIGKLIGIQLDGIMGGLVALFILYSGYQLIRETSTPLLGGAPDPEMVKKIQDLILGFDGIIGIHDLVVHNYGPGRIFASVHIEVDAHGDLIASHDLIDNIERIISHKLGIQIVAHMDPLDTKDPLTAEIHKQLKEIISPIDGILDYHDLRVVAGYTHNNIIFDVVLSSDCKIKEAELKKLLDQKIKALSPSYFTVITVDRSYTR